jgi:CRISPR/Cas system-associated protein endoribonuclease Cas2
MTMMELKRTRKRKNRHLKQIATQIPAVDYLHLVAIAEKQHTTIYKILGKLVLDFLASQPAVKEDSELL